MTPAGMRWAANDACAIYFLDPMSAAAFVLRWCAGSKVEISDVAFRVREDRPTPRAAAGPHKTFCRDSMSESANVFEDRQTPGDWRVEWFDDDGGFEVEIFTGPRARLAIR